PGAGGTIGIGFVAKAPPDGYSIGLGGTSSLAINVALMKLPYEPIRELAPISLVATHSFVAVAYPGAGIQSVSDLIAKAQPRRRRVRSGSDRQVTVPHTILRANSSRR